MAIGVKETQEIIRQVAVVSRNESAVPAKLDPQEVGMATGPRHRKRALLRPGPVPDYLDPATACTDEWQKLDDDVYKFLQIRKDQFGRMGDPPSHQFIVEMESRLKTGEAEYELGTYLGLLRQAADLDHTRQTYVTASEKSAFHAFARRLTDGRRHGETFDPEMVKRFRDLLDTRHPTTFRGLADLFRLVSRAARLPLIGGLEAAPAIAVTLLLQVVDLSTRFNLRTQGSLEFQVGPMDVFLGARTVLFNRSVANPTLSMVKELVLDESGLYHEDLLELLRTVGVFGSELTMLMPDSLCDEGFALQGANYSAVELVMAAGARLSGGGPSQRAMATLADAILYKVQKQDGHKDRQIQSILSHFNRLLQGERRSAARVTQDRQQSRFDYMTAIERAGQLARGMHSGQVPAMGPGGEPRPMLAPRPFVHVSEAMRPDGGEESKAAPRREAQEAPPMALREYSPDAVAGSQPPMPAAVVLGRITSGEYESMLKGWDELLGRIRKRLTARSPVFKSLISQLAKVRALDNCLAYGVTPAGGRVASRLARHIQSGDLRARLGVPEETAEAFEEAFSMAYPGFLASAESLIATMYHGKQELHGIQFRLRDRLPAVRPGLVDLRRGTHGAGAESSGRETTMWADGGELDEVALRLATGTILLALELSGRPDAPQFQTDGTLRFPSISGPSALGDCDPFLAYCLLLGAGGKYPPPGPAADADVKQAQGVAAEELETVLMRLIRLGPEDRKALGKKYREWTGPGKRPAAPSPGLGPTRIREGWRRGFERGFMSEVKEAFDEAEGEGTADARLMKLLTEIQADIDSASTTLEGEKLRLTRERVLRITG